MAELFNQLRHDGGVVMFFRKLAHRFLNVQFHSQLKGVGVKLPVHHFFATYGRSELQLVGHEFESALLLDMLFDIGHNSILFFVLAKVVIFVDLLNRLFVDLFISTG